jgi:hypothetical protein
VPQLLICVSTKEKSKANSVVKSENGIEPFIMRYQSEFEPFDIHGDVSGKWRNRTARIENYVKLVEGIVRENLFMLMCRKSGGIGPHELESTVVISKLR